MSIDDWETWLIDEGDAVIKIEASESKLSPYQSAVYDLWAIDYAVRNAGSLDALEDVRENALVDLKLYAKQHCLEVTCDVLNKVAGLSDDELSDLYEDAFEKICSELESTGKHT